jgi:glucan phosphorylase
MTEFREGFGADDEEVVDPADAADVKQELEDFQYTWSSNENDKLFERVIQKIKSKKNPEEMLKEMRNLGNQLADAMGDQDVEAEILGKYVGVKTSDEEEPSDEDQWPAAA